MSKQHQPHPNPNDPGIDVVPGDPPVPVNIWRLPEGEDLPVGARLATRLLAEYTRPDEPVYDMINSPALREAARATGRSYRPANRFQAPAEPAALAVAIWPLTDHRRDPVTLLSKLCRRLRPGGFLAVIVTPPDQPNQVAPVELGPVVATATAAGLSYLQHVVTMPDSPELSAGAAGPIAAKDGVHQRVHTDVLVFCRAGGADA